MHAMAADDPKPNPFEDEATRVMTDAGRLRRGDTLPSASAPPATPDAVSTPGPSTSRPAAAAAPASTPSRQVGRYQVTERIGRGGMASVFRAHDPNIDRVIAIKFLHPNFSEDEEYRGRFLREARAAGMLSHPNIVTVHDVGEISGRPYMAMELIEGEPLNELMTRMGAMPIKDALVIGLQLAKALGYAHSKGIVHRDIKPSNIMGVRGTTTVKVTDFGIAHVTSKNEQQQTRVGDVLGTPQYMSPEQTKGSKVDGRSDLFSVGIILYQMLSGQPPFMADSIVALAMQIANDQPVPIEQLRPKLPQSVRRIVERCLAKQPERRFQNGEELAAAISAALREIEDEAKESGPRILPLRVKWAVMMATIVFTVMAITGAVVNHQQKKAMTSQVMEYGASLSRFIAAQNATSALADEWVAVEVAVQEIMKTGDFDSVTVIDHQGVVRVASKPELVGKPYEAPLGENLGTRDGAIGLSRYVANGDDVLGFEAPMTFQGKAVGRVALGIDEKPLKQVANLSLTLMAILVLVTVAAVGVAMYFLANYFARPLKLMDQSLLEVAQGRLEHRIREERHDEFGIMFKAFNDMATALQERFMPGAKPAEVVVADSESASTQPPPVDDKPTAA
jgi:serine/threonine-protein kinase